MGFFTNETFLINAIATINLLCKRLIKLNRLWCKNHRLQSNQFVCRPGEVTSQVEKKKVFLPESYITLHNNSSPVTGKLVPEKMVLGPKFSLKISAPPDRIFRENWSVQKYFGPTRRLARSRGACSCAANTASSQTFSV